MEPNQTSLTSSSNPSEQPSAVKREKITFPNVPGLSLIINYLTEAEEQQLWTEINKLPWDREIRHQSRRTQTYGLYYDSHDENRELKTAGALPECIDFLADRIRDEKIMPERPDQYAVNEYEPGQGIGPHIDFSGNEIVNVSLGSDCVMEFHGPQGQKESVVLPRRSLLLVEDDARYLWKHGIPKRKIDKLDDGTTIKRTMRISLTFRIANPTV